MGDDGSRGSASRDAFGEIAPGVYVATAEKYTTNTTIVAGAGGGCLLVDPAVTVADLAALAEWLSERGLSPVAGWSTHPHWDHLLWSPSAGRRAPVRDTARGRGRPAGRVRPCQRRRSERTRA